MNPTPPESESNVEWRRGRPSTKPFSGDDAPDPDRHYSPFWVLTAVFLTLVVLQTIYLRGDFTKRNQIRVAREQLTAPLAKAQTINQMTEAVGRELLALSADSPEAAKIITEFKIQINAPASPAKP